MSAERAQPLPRVGRAELEARLRELCARPGDPRAGIFGPGSKVWEVNRSSIVFLGAGRAALLQLAHPFVAFGIEQHSRTRGDPFGRFQRTFAHVFDMVFGDRDAACRAARAVHAIHERVAGEIPERAGRFPPGTPYRANDPEALLWVHATLWDTSLLCFEAVVRPLSAGEREEWYAETKRFAALFGIPDAVLPADWGSFARYVAGMLAGELLCVTRPAAEMGRFVLAPLPSWLAPLTDRYAEVTAHLLPERLAAGFGLARGGVRGRARHEAVLRRLRALHPHLPERLRYLPAYVAARRRLAGRTGRDRIGEAMSRILVGSPGR
jgi:uncharacterized protein (DUF2236 family)